MGKRLVTTRALTGGIRRHTLTDNVTVSEAQCAKRLKKHFDVPRKESLHLLDCSEIRFISRRIFEAIIEVHRQLAKRGQRLVISAGDDARRYCEYRQKLLAEGVDVFLNNEVAILDLRAHAPSRRRKVC